MESERAYATGAVIISDDGKSQVRYHPQCTKCGYVMIGTTSSAYVGMGCKTNQGYFNCGKCGEAICIKINRGV